MNNRRHKTPVLFVGHGSPMNAIENNEFTRGWVDVAKKIDRPKAILSVSAHWFVAGSLVLGVEKPRTIHDFYGFPDELYRVRYPAPGAVELADSVRDLIKTETVKVADSWGLDHGTWAVIIKMFPDADVPVTQLSVNFTIPNRAHYQIGKELSPLRDEGGADNRQRKHRPQFGDDRLGYSR